MYGKLGPRAVHAWRQIEVWLAARLPVIEQTLRCKGAASTHARNCRGAWGAWVFRPAAGSGAVGPGRLSMVKSVNAYRF